MSVCRGLRRKHCHGFREYLKRGWSWKDRRESFSIQNKIAGTGTKFIDRRLARAATAIIRQLEALNSAEAGPRCMQTRRCTSPSCALPDERIWAISQDVTRGSSDRRKWQRREVKRVRASRGRKATCVERRI